MRLAFDGKVDAPAQTRWLKRIGALGFSFFLVKGLLWLGAAAACAWLGTSA
jgi:hypothetical protein